MQLNYRPVRLLQLFCTLLPSLDTDSTTLLMSSYLPIKTLVARQQHTICNVDSERHHWTSVHVSKVCLELSNSKYGEKQYQPTTRLLWGVCLKITSRSTK